MGLLVSTSYLGTSNMRDLDNLARWKEDNSYKIKRQHKAWRERNKEKLREKAKAYYYANRERILEAARESYAIEKEIDPDYSREKNANKYKKRVDKLKKNTI